MKIAVLPHDTFLKVSYFFLKIGQIILFWYFYTFFYTFFLLSESEGRPTTLDISKVGGLIKPVEI